MLLSENNPEQNHKLLWQESLLGNIKNSFVNLFMLSVSTGVFFELPLQRGTLSTLICLISNSFMDKLMWIAEDAEFPSS